jgi:hypothetical protein
MGNAGEENNAIVLSGLNLRACEGTIELLQLTRSSDLRYCKNERSLYIEVVNIAIEVRMS